MSIRMQTVYARAPVSGCATKRTGAMLILISTRGSQSTKDLQDALPTNLQLPDIGFSPSSMASRETTCIRDTGR